MGIGNWFKGRREKIEASVNEAFPVPERLALPDRGGRQQRIGRLSLWLGMALFLLWALFAPLGQGVPAHGTVKVEGERKLVQHPRGGVVDDIFVKEGDHVEAGQPLVRLNESQAQAQHGIVDSQLVGLLAVEARLQAERMGRNSITFPPFLLERKGNEQVDEAILVQEHLFRTRRAALEGEIAISRETIAGLEQQMRGVQALEKSKAQQLAIFREELASLRPLYEEGFVPRNRLFEVERSIAYLDGQRSEDIANMGRIRSQVGELNLKMLQVREVFRKEVETQLTDVQRQAADYRERRVATQDDLERVVLRAPVAGTVVDLTVHTQGGVVQAGQKLMEIVPAAQSLVIEAKIPPHLVDGLRVGLEADVHFLALDQTIVPTVPGKLIYLSADAMTDPRTEAMYFLGRVQATEEALNKLGDKAIQPGMPADVVIKTGERSLVGYLLKPLLARMKFALTER